MTFLIVLGGVAGAMATVAIVTVGVWACTAKPVTYQVIKRAEIIAENPDKPKPPKEWANES
jgi:hypothetical protein